jgi:hypothetical protein
MMFRHHGTRFWVALGLAAAVFVFYFPSLIAYRYTADTQNSAFLSHPWRSWSFLYTAFTVPGDSRLKTSGVAFRKADAAFEGTALSVVQVRLLFLPKNKPYTLSQQLGARRVTVTVLPPYRFVWEVEGTDSAVAGERRLVIMLLDYRSGAVLYDIRKDLAG